MSQAIAITPSPIFLNCLKEWLALALGITFAVNASRLLSDFYLRNRMRKSPSWPISAGITMYRTSLVYLRRKLESVQVCLGK